MSEHTHKFLLRWEPDGYSAEFDKLRVHWAACGCGETQPLRDFVRNLRRKAAEAEAEIERLKQGYLAAGVNSLSWRFMEAINKLFEPCFTEPKS